MDNKPSINIDKLKSLSSEEHVKVSNLFGLSQHNVKTLLEYGFKYHYDNSYLHSNITINDISYELRIDRYFGDKYKHYYLHVYENTEKREKLKGYKPMSLYCELECDIASFNIDTILYWIKNLYESNSKETFKAFVASEKK